MSPFVLSLFNRRTGAGEEVVGGVAGVADRGMVEAEKEEVTAVKRVAEDVVRDLFGLAETQVPRDGVPDT